MSMDGLRAAAELTTWVGVCTHTGRTPHALMQWNAITTPAPPPRSGGELVLSREGRWDEVQARCGTLGPRALGPLLNVLAPFTGGQDCHHALWEGWGWLTGARTFLTFSTTGGPQSRHRPRQPRPT